MKTKIGELIDPSQSTFLQGWSVLDSIAAAQEIISACAKHHWPTFFLKLEFTKTFDTLDWSSKSSKPRDLDVDGVVGYNPC